MEKKEIAGDRDIYVYLVSRGNNLLGQVPALKETSVNPEKKYKEDDVNCAWEICACALGFLNEAAPDIVQSARIGLSFNHKRTNSSVCLGLTDDNGNTGFGFITEGICLAVGLKIKEAADHGVIMSRETRILAMVGREVRNFLVECGQVKPFEGGDCYYPLDDKELAGILWRLNLLVLSIERGSPGQETIERVRSEVDGNAIEMLITKKITQGVSFDQLAAILKTNAPDRENTEKQPVMLFF
jgi:hypothetical protein